MDCQFKSQMVYLDLSISLNDKKVCMIKTKQIQSRGNVYIDHSYEIWLIHFEEGVIPN